MAVPHQHEQELDPATGSEMLLRTGRRIWDNLPFLLFIDLMLVASAIPALLLVLAGYWMLALPVAAVTCGPMWAGAVATSDRMYHHGDGSVRAFFGMVRSHAVIGVAIGFVPALIATVMLGTISVWAANPGARWLVVPLLLDISLLIIVAACGVSVFSLATTGGLRGWDLWRASLAIAGANPLAIIGSLTLLVVVCSVLGQLAPMVLPVLLAPFATLCSAVTWSTSEHYMRMLSRN